MDKMKQIDEEEIKDKHLYALAIACKHTGIDFVVTEDEETGRQYIGLDLYHPPRPFGGIQQC